MPTPTLDDVRTWTQVPASAVDDASLQHVLNAESDLQAAQCDVTSDSDALYQALLRRCARHLAARGVPLGITGDSELGAQQQLQTWDAEVQRLERPYRLQVLA